MGKTTTILCDQCEKDITCTGNTYQYRIVLGDESMPRCPGDGCVTLMHLPPYFKQTRYFCGAECFWDWCRERLRKQSEWKRARAAKRKAHPPRTMTSGVALCSDQSITILDLNGP